jgi:hypothetical protein
MEKQTLRFTTLRRETQKAFCFNGVWIPKSIASVERLNTYDYRVTVPKWFVDRRNLQKRVVDPDSRAAYDHWNEEGDYHYYSEHPEIFGRGAGYDYPADDDDRFPNHPNFIDGDEYQ